MKKLELTSKIPVGYDSINSLNLRSDLEASYIGEEGDMEGAFLVPKGSISDDTESFAIDLEDNDGEVQESYLYSSEYEYDQDLVTLGFVAIPFQAHLSTIEKRLIEYLEMELHKTNGISESDNITFFAFPTIAEMEISELDNKGKILSGYQKDVTISDLLDAGSISVYDVVSLYEDLFNFNRK